MRYTTDIDNKNQHLPAEIIRLLNSKCKNVVCIGVREYRYFWEGPEMAEEINNELKSNGIKFNYKEIQ